MRCAQIMSFSAACILLVPPVRSQTLGDVTASFSQLIADRYAAISNRDSAALHQQLADDMSWVLAVTGRPMSAAQFLTAVSNAQGPRARFEIDSVDARVFGEVATVTYRRTDHRVAGTFEDVHSSRSLEVLARRGGRWQLLQHSETWIVNSPPSVSLDSAALSAFVGRYHVGPGFVDNVHWEGKDLVATSTAETRGARLIPVSANAFSPNGVAPLIVFERDAAGHVVGYVQQSPDGFVRRAPRIP